MALPAWPAEGRAVGQRLTQAGDVRRPAQRAGQADDGDGAEQRRQAELERAVGEDRGGGGREWRAVQDEGRDQAAVRSADAAGQRDQPAELADDVGEHEHADRGEIADRCEGGAERGEVERHVGDRPADRERVARAYEPARVVDPAAERRRARAQQAADAPLAPAFARARE